MAQREISAVMELQRQFLGAGAAGDPAYRRERLIRLREVIRERADQLYAALEADFHKPPTESYFTEYFLVINELSQAISNVAKWARPRRASTPLYWQPGHSCVLPQPLGQVLIIAPCNYPFQLLFNPLIGAVAAGNCCVVKPSERVPATAELIRKIIELAFEPGHVTALLGDGHLARRLVEQRFDHIFFTGSSGVGRQVAQAAAANLTPATLELGGKNPCVVDRTADPEQASRKIAWGKFLNAGQSCVAPDYVLVHSDVEQQLLEQLAARVTEFYGADPQSSPDFARIIHHGQLEQLRAMLGGGEVTVGGVIDEGDLYVSPTILTDVDPDSLLMREEIFGPLLPVLPFGELDEAVARINSLPEALALYVFSRDHRFDDQLIAATSSGGVCVQDTMAQMSTPTLPFGGVGESGIGRYHGRHTFDTFSHHRAVMRRSSRLDGAFFRYPPYAGRQRWINLLKKIYG